MNGICLEVEKANLQCRRLQVICLAETTSDDHLILQKSVFFLVSLDFSAQTESVLTVFCPGVEHIRCDEDVTRVEEQECYVETDINHRVQLSPFLLTNLRLK